MNRPAVLATTAAASLLFLGFALLLVGRHSYAQQQSDTDKIKATLEAFQVAISSKDIRKMDDVWAHDLYVMSVNPRDKGVSIGWAAVRKNWETNFTFTSELRVQTQDGPLIHIDGNIAWLDGIAAVNGKTNTGDVVNAPTFEMQVLEKRDNRWLIVSHTGLRVPQ